MISNVENIDCIEGMKQFPDKFFQLGLIDPPYGINAPIMANTPTQRKAVNRLQRLNGGGGKLKNRVLNTAKNINWDDKIPSEEYFKELFRVCQNVIIWGGNYFPLPPSRCIIVWDKCQPWENFSQVEIAWTSFDSPAQLFKFDNRTGGKIHPTQKPVELYTYLLEKYAKKGDRILDTNLGSQSSRIAAYKKGFDFWGFEIDKDYFEQGNQRFEKSIAMPLFDAPKELSCRQLSLA